MPFLWFSFFSFLVWLTQGTEALLTPSKTYYLPNKKRMSSAFQAKYRQSETLCLSNVTFPLLSSCWTVLVHVKLRKAAGVLVWGWRGKGMSSLGSQIVKDQKNQSWIFLSCVSDYTQKYTSVFLLYCCQFNHVRLCDPMDCSMPGFPVHQLPELAQTHVHRVTDAIQPSHPLLSTFPPAFNLKNWWRTDAIKWPKSLDD